MQKNPPIPFFSLKKTLLLIFFLTLPLGLQANGFKGFQLWNNVTLNHSLNKTFSFSTELTTRLKERPFRVYYYEAEFDLIAELRENWEFTIGHQVQYEKSNINKWANLPAPLISLNKRWEFHPFTLSNRSRGEYCFNGNQWTYRNRTQLEINLCKWTPFSYQEFFFTEGEGYNENRLFFGIKRPFSHLSSLSLGYLYLLEKSGRHWDRYNALNWNLSFSF